jgi:hypothetical protein
MKFEQIQIKLIPEIWEIASTIYINFSNYIKENLVSLLIYNKYDYSHQNISGDNFLLDKDIFIQPKPKSMQLRDYSLHFSGIWVGVNLNPNRYHKVAFYYWIQLKPNYNKFYFDEYCEAKKFKEILYNRGWEFIYYDNYWIIVKYFPIENLIISGNEWKHQLDDFYTKAMDEAEEFIFNVKSWGL